MNRQVLYTFNSICILIVSFFLSGAFYFQFVMHEEPCPLCLLQRMGMIAVITGLSFNVFLGFRNIHFALLIIGALMGGLFSVRQVLLHICPLPGESLGYGTPIMGMHLYSWGVVIFVASILGAAIFLVFVKNEESSFTRKPLMFEKVTFYWVVFLTAANVIAAFSECAFGPCCENGPCL